MNSEPMGESAAGLLYLTGGPAVHAAEYSHDDRELHTHGFLELAVVVDGAAVHTSLAGEQAVSRGDVIVLRPGAWHGYRRCENLRLYNCCVSAEVLDHELAWTREDPLLGHLLWTGPMATGRQGILTTRLDEPALRACLPRLKALARLPSRPRENRTAEGIGHLVLLAGVVGEAARRDQPTSAQQDAANPVVSRALGLVESALAYPWTLAELAGELHVTPSYLVRLFRSATGLPPMAYLARRRAELAASLLLRTDRSVTQIARDVGWPDQNYFARRFKAHLGMSATAYRRQFAGR